jgi:prepilin-type N-terminal cleavage/methylation domain-containing protein
MQSVRRGSVPNHGTRVGRGFTLVELLVVMAIIALLASLLFPAIQRVREGGRRTACLNQMHNLAIASHDYNNVYRTLPSGWISDFSGPPAVTVNIQQPIQLQIANNQQLNITGQYEVSAEWGWHALMLEQIEESNLRPDWNIPKVDPFAGGGAPPTVNWQRIQYDIEVYTCPSASMPNVRPGNLGYTNYRGNLGYWPQSAAAPLDNGPFYVNSHVELDRDFRDGTAHTLMFGESLLGFWGDAYSCCARFRDDYANPNYFDQYWNGGTPARHFFGFGSYHGDMVNFVFADAHQLSIAKNTDRIVLQAIATRNGGEPQRISD